MKINQSIFGRNSYCYIPVFLLLFILNSCKKDSFVKNEKEITTVSRNFNRSARLSKSNPFSLKVMKAAATQLYGSEYAENMLPTHVYMRYKPATIDEADELTSRTDLVWQNFPFDYSVGDVDDEYKDPDLSEDELPWLYTFFPVDNKISTLIYAEELEELYITSETEKELEELAYVISGNKEYEEPEPTENGASFRRRSEYKPRGVLKVHNTKTGADEVLKNAKIRIVDWFKVSEVYTNSSGYFESDKEYRVNVDIYMLCTNSKYTLYDNRSSLLFFAIPKIANEVRADPFNFTIYYSTATRLWALATMHNAYFRYATDAPSSGISAQPDGMRLWVVSKDDDEGGVGATPMLHKGIFTLGITNPEWGIAVNILGVSPLLSTLQVALRKYLPDMLLTWDATMETDQIDDLIFHECAHSSHYLKAGNIFWGRYVSEIITHAGYGRWDHPNAEMIALSEGWASYVEMHLYCLKYGLTPRDLLDIETIEGVTVTSGRDYIRLVRGLFYDLMDDSSVRIEAYDKVNYYSLIQLYNAFSSSTTNFDTYLNNLKTLYSNPDEIYLPDLSVRYKFVMNPDNSM